MKRYFSAFVDARTDLVREADLLAWSLVRLGRVSPDDVILHVVEELEPSDFPVAFKMGVRFQRTPRWQAGDGNWLGLAHCNKIMQLLAGGLDEAASVLLLDCDVVVTQPVREFRPGVSGRLAEHAFVPLADFQEVYARAGYGFSLGRASQSGERIPDNWFNSGVIAIEGGVHRRVGEEWARWATWLQENSELPKIRRSIDEIALSLALKSGEFRYQRIDRRFNLPVGLPQPFWKDNDPVIIHYMNHFNNGGVLRNVPRGKRFTVNYALRTNRRIKWLNRQLMEYRDMGGLFPQK